MDRAFPDSAIAPRHQADAVVGSSDDGYTARLERLLIKAPTEAVPLDGEIVALAAAFCDAYARNGRADRALMAGTGTEEEWRPLYDETSALMDRLVSAVPTTVVGMALKCLVLAGGTAWQIGTDERAAGLAYMDLISVQFEDAMLAGTLTPLDAKAPRDWQAFAAMHPGQVPYPAHAPTILLALELAIPQEARRLLNLAEAEFERRRQAYVGYHDPDIWPSVAAELRREMRMDALALVAAPTPDGDTPPDSRPDPVHALIAGHRAAYAEWDRTSAVWNGMVSGAPGYSEAVKASRGPGEREYDAFSTLFSAKPTTLAGVTALAGYLVTATAQARVDADASDGERALGTIAASLARLDHVRGTAPTAHPDATLLAYAPVVIELKARVTAFWPDLRRTEMAAHEAVGPSPEAHTPECRAWSDRLAAEEVANGHAAAAAAHEAACDELFSTLRDLAEMPATTLDGLIFKARLAHEHEEKEVSESIVADLIAMGERGVVGTAAVRLADAAPTATGHDLSGLSIDDLARLYGVVDRIEDIVGSYGNAPCFFDARSRTSSPAGAIIDREADRLDSLRSAIADEMERRRPADDDERDVRLSTLVRHAIPAGSMIEDKALVAELVAAWGA